MAEMSNGKFCWNELATTDAAGSATFYGQLFGWTTADSQLEGVKYVRFKKDGQDVGGMIQMDARWGGVRPHWMSYVSVADVDATAGRVAGLGGKVCVPPTDIPNVGRFAMLEDPSGAVLSIIQWKA
jgi:predicted enzyme related to lactoylglutathione lyase